MTAAEQVRAIDHIIDVIEVTIAALRHQAVDIDSSAADVLQESASNALCAVRDAITKANGVAPETDAD